MVVVGLVAGEFSLDNWVRNFYLLNASYMLRMKDYIKTCLVREAELRRVAKKTPLWCSAALNGGGTYTNYNGKLNTEEWEWGKVINAYLIQWFALVFIGYSVTANVDSPPRGERMRNPTWQGSYKLVIVAEIVSWPYDRI